MFLACFFLTVVNIRIRARDRSNVFVFINASTADRCWKHYH